MSLNKKKAIAIGGVLIGLVLILGILGMQFAMHALEVSKKNSLLLRAGTIALSLNPDEVASLEGNESDLQSENYKTLKRSLTGVRALNNDVRFVYIMGVKDDHQFFYVDSEDPSSPDYSYPGQPYNDFFPEEIKYFNEGKSYTMGPYSDAWGEWYTAMAPVITEEQEVVGMVGLDIAAEDIELRMAIIQAAGLVIIGLICLCIITLILFWLKSSELKSKV